MKKKTNDTLKNKSILIGLSVLCTGLIAVSFLENDAVSPIRQASGFVITPIQKGINGFGSWLSGLTILRMLFRFEKRTKSCRQRLIH